MTAAVAIWESGLMEVFAAFPDNPNLMARSQADAVGSRYQVMADRGELWTYPGRTTPVGAFLGDVAARLGTIPHAIAADYYRKTDVLDGLSNAGITGWPIEWRRMGTGPEGSQDVRAFQRSVLASRLAARTSLLIRSAIGESLIRYDGNGNQSLDRKRQRGRIDVLSAGVLAAGLHERLANQPVRRGYIGMID